MYSDLEMVEYEKLDEEIERLLEKMSGHDPTSEEYKSMVSHLSALMKVQEIASNINAKIADCETKYLETEARVKQLEIDGQLKVKEADSPRRVSPDTWAIVGANILGIVLIIGHERVNVIASKALGFILRTR